MESLPFRDLLDFSFASETAHPIYYQDNFWGCSLPRMTDKCEFIYSKPSNYIGASSIGTDLLITNDNLNNMIEHIPNIIENNSVLQLRILVNESTVSRLPVTVGGFL